MEKNLSSGGLTGDGAAVLRSERVSSEDFRKSASPPHVVPPLARQLAALDLGTNNCRLLVARQAGSGFRVVDAFSRIVRLGEGLAATGALSDAAMARTLDALRICAEKIAARKVAAGRYVATEACRATRSRQLLVPRSSAASWRAKGWTTCGDGALSRRSPEETRSDRSAVAPLLVNPPLLMFFSTAG